MQAEAAQQLRRRRPGAGVVVIGLNRADQLEPGKFGGGDAAEAFEALAVVAQPQRAGDEADPPIGAEAAEQRGGGAAGGDVVNADIVAAG